MTLDDDVNKQTTVLVVEDDKDIREAMNACLCGRFNVVEVPNGTLAL